MMIGGIEQHDRRYNEDIMISCLLVIDNVINMDYILIIWINYHLAVQHSNGSHDPFEIDGLMMIYISIKHGDFP
jgi:hypothetical protein